MLEDQFANVMDRWMAEVRTEAIRLFRDAVPVDRCIPIAISIVDARDVGRARVQQQLVVTPRPAQVGN